jgi:hypothetical protein
MESRIFSQHLWAGENLCAIHPSNHDQWFSINMWVGICGDNLFGPHILPDRLTGQMEKWLVGCSSW